MSSLKDAAAALQLAAQFDGDGDTQNKVSMSVTPDVSHMEIWPYVASAAVGSANHASRAV
jgi:hypothetical protein